jgi:hypothetical protein
VYKAAIITFSTPMFYLCIVLCVAFVLIFDEFIHLILYTLYPTYS